MKRKLEVVEEWEYAAQREKSYFVKFALEYFAFNSLLRLKFSDDHTRDRDLIERFKGWVQCKNPQFEDKDAIRNLMKTTRERSLKNLTRTEYISIKNDKDWNNIIEAVYTIRNNLFHGHKQYSRDRDEQLVKAGYKILYIFNKWLIENLKEEYNIKGM